MMTEEKSSKNLKEEDEEDDDNNDEESQTPNVDWSKEVQQQQEKAEKSKQEPPNTDWSKEPEPNSIIQSQDDEKDEESKLCTRKETPKTKNPTDKKEETKEALTQVASSMKDQGQPQDLPTPVAANTTGAAPTTTSSPPEHKTHVVIGEYDIRVPDDKVPLLGIMAASVILLIAVFLQDVYERDNDHGKYGVAVAVVSFCASFVSLILPNKLFVVFLLNNFLFIWSFIAACVLTFGDGPFTSTGNGYFALWAMVVLSAFVSDAPGRGRRARSISDKLNAIMGMGAASLVVLIALGFEFRNDVTDSTYAGEAIYGIIVAITSLLATCFYTFMQCWRGRSRTCCERPILTAYAVMWIIAAAAMTFGGPFLNTGNGYFASWIAAIVSAKAASLCWTQSEHQ